VKEEGKRSNQSLVIHMKVGERDRVTQGILTREGFKYGSYHGVFWVFDDLVIEYMKEIKGEINHISGIGGSKGVR